MHCNQSTDRLSGKKPICSRGCEMRHFARRNLLFGLAIAVLGWLAQQVNNSDQFGFSFMTLGFFLLGVILTVYGLLGLILGSLDK